MFGMGSWELVIIFLVVLLVFGAKRIPEMAQGLGKGIREFRKAVHEVQDEIDVSNVKSTPPASGASEPGKIAAPEGAVAETSNNSETSGAPVPQSQGKPPAATPPPPA